MRLSRHVVQHPTKLYWVYYTSLERDHLACSLARLSSSQAGEESHSWTPYSDSSSESWSNIDYCLYYSLGCHCLCCHDCLESHYWSTPSAHHSTLSLPHLGPSITFTSSLWSGKDCFGCAYWGSWGLTLALSWTWSQVVSYHEAQSLLWQHHSCWSIPLYD